MKNLRFIGKFIVVSSRSLASAVNLVALKEITLLAPFVDTSIRAAS